VNTWATCIVYSKKNRNKMFKIPICYVLKWDLKHCTGLEKGQGWNSLWIRFGQLNFSVTKGHSSLMFFCQNKAHGVNPIKEIIDKKIEWVLNILKVH